MIYIFVDLCYISTDLNFGHVSFGTWCTPKFTYWCLCVLRFAMPVDTASCTSVLYRKRFATQLLCVIWCNIFTMCADECFYNMCCCNETVCWPDCKPEGPLFSAEFEFVCLWVCLSVCLWPALLPFNLNRFWQNLVTRTLLWSSLAATIMDQIGRRGTARCLFWKISEKILKNHRILISKFWSIIFFASVSPVYCKIISTRFEQNWRRRYIVKLAPMAIPAMALLQQHDARRNWTGGAASCCDRSSGAFRTGGVQNWAHNLAVKTHRLVFCLSVTFMYYIKMAADHH